MDNIYWSKNRYLILVSISLNFLYNTAVVCFLNESEVQIQSFVADVTENVYFLGRIFMWYPSNVSAQRSDIYILFFVYIRSGIQTIEAGLNSNV